MTGKPFTKFFFYASLVASVGYFGASIWLVRQGVPTWQAAAMGLFFMGLAYIHHRRLK